MIDRAQLAEVIREAMLVTSAHGYADERVERYVDRVLALVGPEVERRCTNYGTTADYCVGVAYWCTGCVRHDRESVDAERDRLREQVRVLRDALTDLAGLFQMGAELDTPAFVTHALARTAPQPPAQSLPGGTQPG